jgi:hypothetical protein
MEFMLVIADWIREVVQPRLMFDEIEPWHPEQYDVKRETASFDGGGGVGDGESEGAPMAVAIA